MPDTVVGRPLIVDVCGTLVDQDTTIGLLAHHFGRLASRRWRLSLLRLLTGRGSPFRLLVAVLERTTGRYLLKHALVRLLAGDSVGDLEVSAGEYAAWLLAERRVRRVSDILRAHEGRSELVLASASLQPIVAALANHLNAGYIASDLEINANFLSGRISRDITGNKAEVLEEKYGLDFLRNGYVAISDNLTDLTLLKGASAAYVVLRRAEHRVRWSDLPADYLPVDS